MLVAESLDSSVLHRLPPHRQLGLAPATALAGRLQPPNGTWLIQTTDLVLHLKPNTITRPWPDARGSRSRGVSGLPETSLIPFNSTLPRRPVNKELMPVVWVNHRNHRVHEYSRPG